MRVDVRAGKLSNSTSSLLLGALSFLHETKDMESVLSQCKDFNGSDPSRAKSFYRAWVWELALRRFVRHDNKKYFHTRKTLQNEKPKSRKLLNGEFYIPSRDSLRFSHCWRRGEEEEHFRALILPLRATRIETFFRSSLED